MLKLIKLLNQYEEERTSTKNARGMDSDKELHFATIRANFSKMLLISKEYGFLTWLVKKRKINYEKAVQELGNKYCAKDSLTMLCAIQDDVVSFLCSLLR